MPLYEYKCGSCGHEFEDLRKTADETISCTNCGQPARKQVSRFAPVIAGGGAAESIDMTIGREADKRWQMVNDRQSKRRQGRDLKEVETPKAKTGGYAPVMALGGTQEKKIRGEYTTALQEHRKEREKKGQPQFDGSGEF